MGILKLSSTTMIISVLVWLQTGLSWNGSVKGTINPPDGGIRAWVLSASDTLKADIDRGIFVIPAVKPGIYRIVMEAKPPFKNAIREGIAVRDGVISDVGEIRLVQ
jgi:hypothetical protein